ncbi:MAG TPA: pyrimidine 5'-nucleotidase [Burkholderiales bacterium]|nr:pyrimidine 5'-nucleotidase [Burkholderiales bacterium]
MLTWLFDLDDTLHDASPHIFPHINRSMTAYLQAHLGLEEERANALRSHYWQRYGATLSGLMRHHQTDPTHFLAETHHFPQLDRMIVADRAALAAVRNLPGRKILYSNAPATYVGAVLEILKLGRCFDAVYAIEDLAYVPKPSVDAFRQLLRVEKLHPSRTVMVDDTLVNLRTAHRLGIRTIWVSRTAHYPAYVDARVCSLRNLRRLLHKLCPMQL